MNPLAIPALLGGGTMGPTLLIVAGLVLVGTNGYTAYKAFDLGQQDIRADWNQEKADRANAALEVTNKFNKEKSEVERAARQKVAELDAQRQRELEEKERENEKLRGRIASGAVRLSVPTTCPRTTTVGVGVGGSAAPGTTSVADGASRAELPAAVALDILAIGDDADRNTKQLADAQALIRLYVDQCGVAREGAPRK